MHDEARTDRELSQAAVFESPPERRPTPSPYTAATGGAATSVIYKSFRPKQHVTVDLVYRDRIYRLKGTFVIDVEHLDDGDTVFVSHRSLPVHGYGDTLAEALAAFAEAFDLQWIRLVEEEDSSKLTPSGLRSRSALEGVVESVGLR